ncbi:MAG: XRE family transcriptional regulator [bacterium]|nr:XRE family transcriptional regulator [bacterium]
MKLDELITLIQTKTGEFINQSQLANCLGITRQTVSNRIKNESQVTVSELKKAEEYFKINLFNDTFEREEKIAYIDYYPDVFASCGNGNIVFSERKTKLPLPTSLISGFSESKTYSIINATGNSMCPTIENGNKLIVEHWDGSQIQDNKIYVFSFNNEIYIKRLSKNLDEIIIKSDNPEYRTRTISGNTAFELTLLGRIVGIIKSL